MEVEFHIVVLEFPEVDLQGMNKLLI